MGWVDSVVDGACKWLQRWHVFWNIVLLLLLLPLLPMFTSIRRAFDSIWLCAWRKRACAYPHKRRRPPFLLERLGGTPVGRIVVLLLPLLQLLLLQRAPTLRDRQRPHMLQLLRCSGLHRSLLLLLQSLLLLKLLLREQGLLLWRLLLGGLLLMILLLRPILLLMGLKGFVSLCILHGKRRHWLLHGFRLRLPG